MNLTKGDNMKFKLIAGGLCALALAACGESSTQNPELLKGANFISAQPDANIILSFDSQEMRVYGRVVNLYNGAYTVDGDKIKFDGFATTMMMGPTEAMETESEYFQFMPTVEKYELSDGKLTLIGENGKEIIFEQVDKIPEDSSAIITVK